MLRTELGLQDALWAATLALHPVSTNSFVAERQAETKQHSFVRCSQLGTHALESKGVGLKQMAGTPGISFVLHYVLVCLLSRLCQVSDLYSWEREAYIGEGDAY